MKELNTKFGKLYIDELNEVVDNKIRIYDSDKRYLDYWELCALEELAKDRKTTMEKLFENWRNNICKCENIYDLFDFELCLDIDGIDTSIDIIKKHLGWNDEIDGVFDYKEQDFVNRIGDCYIVISE